MELYNNIAMKPQPQPQPQQIIHVLLADDHIIVRAGIRQFLEQTQDIQVIAEASNGQEACELLEQLKPDVAVLDIQMPLMSGIEVTRWIRANRLPIGILVLTAYDDEPYVQAVLQAGANGYVLKTAEPQEIIQGVRDVFQGKSVLDVSLAQKLIARLAGNEDTMTVEPLTDRELQVLTLTAKGFTNKSIGVQLGISDRTVQNHLANIFQKMNAESRTEAVMRAVTLGLIPANIDEIS
ncbi:MAG: DNA-binding response regulator [Anaerolineaceae bacterium]|nr:DNA-binding response regulator [Anaerolineaceae bacterium]